MQKIKIILFLLFISLTAYTQYITPGTGVNWDLEELMSNSGGTITHDGTDYIFNEDITISVNDTIQILNNASIKISTGKLITIFGMLYTDPPAPITFSAVDTTQNFLGFRFEDSNDSQLKNCVIEFGGGIKLVNADIRIENCLIQKNNTSNSTGAIDLYQSNPTIQNCEISSNEGPAIMSAANSNSSPFIYQNDIYHNNTSNQNMPQINLGTSADNEEIIIENNTIEGLYDNSGGVALSTLIGGNVNASVIGNTIVNNRYGITAYGNNINTVISNNIIQDNNIQGDPMLGGSGINFYGDQTNQSIVSRNTISGNLWGITIQNQAKPNLGQIQTDTVNIGLNSFYENGNGGVTYALYNNTPNDIFAENNYWGTFDPEIAETYIFHQPDDPGLGIIDFLPLKDYLTAIPNELKIKENIIDVVFPLPFENDLSIRFSEKVEVNSLKQINIYDLTGKLVFECKTNASEFVIHDIDINPGLFLLEVKTSQQSAIRKIIRK